MITTRHHIALAFTGLAILLSQTSHIDPAAASEAAAATSQATSFRPPPCVVCPNGMVACGNEPFCPDFNAL